MEGGWVEPGLTPELASNRARFDVIERVSPSARFPPSACVSVLEFGCPSRYPPSTATSSVSNSLGLSLSAALAAARSSRCACRSERSSAVEYCEKSFPRASQSWTRRIARSASKPRASVSSGSMSSSSSSSYSAWSSSSESSPGIDSLSSSSVHSRCEFASSGLSSEGSGESSIWRDLGLGLEFFFAAFFAFRAFVRRIWLDRL